MHRSEGHCWVHYWHVAFSFMKFACNLISDQISSVIIPPCVIQTLSSMYLLLCLESFHFGCRNLSCGCKKGKSDLWKPSLFVLGKILQNFVTWQLFPSTTVQASHKLKRHMVGTIVVCVLKTEVLLTVSPVEAVTDWLTGNTGFSSTLLHKLQAATVKTWFALQTHWLPLVVHCDSFYYHVVITITFPKPLLSTHTNVHRNCIVAFE